MITNQCILDQGSGVLTYNLQPAVITDLRALSWSGNGTIRLDWPNINFQDIQLIYSGQQCPSRTLFPLSNVFFLNLSVCRGQLVTFTMTRKTGVFLGNATVIPISPPSPPFNLVAELSSPMQIRLNWTLPIDLGAGLRQNYRLLYYTIQYQIAQKQAVSIQIRCCAGSWTRCCGLQSAQIVLNTSDKGKAVTISLKAGNAAGDSIASGIVTISPLTGPPAPPLVTVSVFSPDGSSGAGLIISLNFSQDTGNGLQNVTDSLQLGKLKYYQLAYSVLNDTTATMSALVNLCTSTLAYSCPYAFAVSALPLCYEAVPCVTCQLCTNQLSLNATNIVLKSGISAGKFYGIQASVFNGLGESTPSQVLFAQKTAQRPHLTTLREAWALPLLRFK